MSPRVSQCEETSDTIVAVSSAAGAAERAIVRMSGPGAISAANAVFDTGEGPSAAELPAWSVVPGVLSMSALVAPVPALLYLMRAPRSYTREDVVEFHVIGSPAVTAAVVGELTSRGVRLARPGEFTERAYLSGRIDLSQAEAVLKLIHAGDDAQRRLALGELTGEFSKRIERLAGSLVETLTQVELALDFAEDDVPVVSADELTENLAARAADVEELLASGTSRYVFSERARLSIIGRTNVGKSSLFNRLLGRDEAIVTDISGTTRDVLEEELDLDGTGLLLVDTAGEKHPPGNTVDRCAAGGPSAPDRIAGRCATAGLSSRASEDRCAAGGLPTRPPVDPDEIALERARAEFERADLVILVIDASEPLTAIDVTLLERLSGPFPLFPGGDCPATGAPRRGEGESPVAPALIVLNKTDLPVNGETERVARSRGMVVSTSCATGAGIDRLRDEIRASLATRGVERQGLRFLLNIRQLNSLRSAAGALVRAAGAAREDLGLEFPAAEIRTAVNHLRELTHPLREEEILDAIFSRFCIGK